MRVGIGYDVHRLGEGEDLILGGVHIPYDKGLIGHSDADVLTHAIMDAILGALGRKDIGYHFPDTEEKYKGISSLKLLERVQELMARDGYQLGNLDSIIIAQAPRLAPFIDQMIQNVTRVLKVEPGQVNIKATTTEKLGFVGRGEGIAAQVIVLIKKREEESEEVGR
ncbi:2-C-methyl-D-erythritol 2,4-cyclodiphosphate synthase [Anoxybacter fermentans]|uniref:2-C-methyl-D-erythritol 2,4-cyclodiphosphate synthase n=1 Tax=Anoxybacter fermentans TaxID=1323375 RepID=A0A3Q9HSI9_9FIRM|nr:2-C-methyl-D-erythritol 2,4-cyclodiphosphate synthase [Anoxybacter fermentans]AZR74692.1 2-C-methyl-D-erythritol 2,4-cyclodiphosphate synthase [Anoxybacter fermentans]